MKRTFTLVALALLAFSACKNEPKPAAEAEETTPKTIGTIERSAPELDNLLAADAKIELLGEGYNWSEGPVWIADGNYLLFSDVPENTIYKWSEAAGAAKFLAPSGYTGDPAEKREGSNGLLLDAQGNLVLCQHGDRRMAKLNAPFDTVKVEYVTLADKWQGKRFNSPNDAVYDKKGNLYFTDPPYGLPKQMEDPGKEIPFQGVYRLGTDGSVTMLVDSLTRPNGIAFSPDEKILYVANSDPDKALWMAYDVLENGSLANGRVFYDATSMVKTHKGLPDGMKVNKEGIVFGTGPGGVWVFSPDGKVLGRIDPGEATANCAFSPDQKTLFMTADMYLCRIVLK